MSVKERLQQMIRKEAIPHALLFTGGIAEEMAYWFAKEVISLNGIDASKKIESKTHPDLHIYLPEGKILMHSLQSLKDLSSTASLSPFESTWKVFIIHDAERMLPTSANALLKTLEEPPPQSLILLISQHVEKILATLRSRCQIMEFPLPKKRGSQEVCGLLAGKITKEEFEKNYQEKMSQDIHFQTAFFETIFLWYRDRELIELGNEAKKYFALSDWTSHIEKTPPCPLETVEKTLKTVRLAIERSVKLSHCLDFLFTSLQF